MSRTFTLMLMTLIVITVQAQFLALSYTTTAIGFTDASVVIYGFNIAGYDNPDTNLTGDTQIIGIKKVESKSNK